MRRVVVDGIEIYEENILSMANNLMMIWRCVIENL